METKFKILMHGQFAVDERLLYKGIYTTTTPKLHRADTTIELIIENIVSCKHLMTNDNDTISHIDNLKKCILREVELTVVR